MRFSYIMCATTLLVAIGGCGGNPSSPTAPTTPVTSPQPSPQPPGGPTTGRVTDVLQNAVGVSSSVLSGDGFPQATADPNGYFELRSTIGGAYALAISAQSYVERRTRINVPGQNALFTLIPSSFDLPTFDEMCRSYQGQLARWMDQPNLVIQKNLIDWTNSSGGYLVLDETMSDADLSCMESRMRDAVSVMSGGALNIGSVSISSAQPGTRVSQTSTTGSITVWGAKNLDAAGRAGGSFDSDMVIRSASAYLIAGRSDPSLPNTYQTRCDSIGGGGGEAGVRQLYRHEIGHALGYQHVTRRSSIMAAGPPLLSTVTDFDRQAMAIVYQRAPGNGTPDVDTPTFSANLAGNARVWLVR